MDPTVSKFEEAGMQEELLEDVRRLQHQIDRVTASHNPAHTARRRQLWACLEWRLHKLAEMQKASARTR
ncbi:MAG: hypothetical protein P8076_11940 [Gammaproteobacteria bacterium]|jgi:hypothetical protein